MPFVWSIGTIIGPAIGGTLAKPAVSMPSIFSPDGVFATFPYLLPNLVCAGLLFLSFIFGYSCLVETHPDMQKYSTIDDLDNTTAETPLFVTQAATAHDGVDLRGDTYGTFNTVDIFNEKDWLAKTENLSRSSSISSKNPEKKIVTRKIAMILIALGIFTYHSMTYDSLLPIFLQDDRMGSTSSTSPFNIPGGLGLSTQDVGIIMAVNGIIALVIQAVVFPVFAAWLGIWRLFVIVTILHPIDYFIVPYLAFLREGSVYAGIYTCLSIRNFTSILAWPIILILLKEAVTSPSNLGKVNGLAASAGAACRTIAPPIAGYLYGVGTSIGFTGLAWWASAIVAIIGSFQILTLKRTKSKTATVRPMATFIENAMPEQRRDGDYIVITESDEEV